MGSQILKSAIPYSIFAHQYLGNYCLQIVIDTTLANTTKKLESPEMGIEYHLQFLTGISDTKQFTAMAQTEMGNLYLDSDATQLDLLVAPIKLAIFAQPLEKVKLVSIDSLQNPGYIGHRFRFELDTNSGKDWTVIPILGGH